MMSAFGKVSPVSIGLMVGAIFFSNLGLALGLLHVSSSTLVTAVRPYFSYSYCEKKSIHCSNKRDVEGLQTAARE